jgi:hypothetical protein
MTQTPEQLRSYGWSGDERMASLRPHLRVNVGHPPLARPVRLPELPRRTPAAGLAG